MDLIIHHNDLDGWACVYVVQKSYGESAPVLTHAVQYGDNFSEILEGIASYRNVWILDFALEASVLERVARNAPGTRFHVIDHHKTTVVPTLPNVVSHLDSSQYVAAVDIVRRTVGDGHLTDDQKRICYLIGRYDTYDKRDMPVFLEAETLNLVLRTYMSDYFGFSKFMDNVSIGGVTLFDILKDGQHMFEYRNALVWDIVQTKHIVRLDDITCYAVNSSCLVSAVGNALAEMSAQDHMSPVGLVYSFDGSKWYMHLRSIGDFDVSTIATKYGGGGHKNAAGFIVQRIPFVSSPANTERNERNNENRI